MQSNVLLLVSDLITLLRSLFMKKTKKQPSWWTLFCEQLINEDFGVWLTNVLKLNCISFFLYEGLPPLWHATWIWPNIPWTSRPARYNLRAVRTFLLIFWCIEDSWAWAVSVSEREADSWWLGLMDMRASKVKDQNTIESLSHISWGGSFPSSDCVHVKSVLGQNTEP